MAETENCPMDCGGESSDVAKLSLTVAFKGTKHSLQLAANANVEQLKEEVESITKVPKAMQKLIAPGAKFKDETATLSEAGLKTGTKIMLVGSTMDEALKAAAKPSAAELKATPASATAAKEKLCERPEHAKQIAKGIPDDAMPGILESDEPLPPALKGMRNRQGAKLRLTFKLEEDELWVATPERTEKLPMANIASVVSEKIVGHEEYSLVGFQLGPTEASRLWVYWVPSQYVKAIKRLIH